MYRVKSSTCFNSGSTCSRVQKRCASSWVKPRTRASPWSTPDFSRRYTVPSSAIRMGRSRYEFFRRLKIRMWKGQFIGFSTYSFSSTFMKYMFWR